MLSARDYQELDYCIKLAGSYLMQDRSKYKSGALDAALERLHGLSKKLTAESKNPSVHVICSICGGERTFSQANQCCIITSA